MNIKKIIFSLFLFGMVSAPIMSMDKRGDDISRFAAQYQKFDTMGYGIVDSGPAGVPTSFLGMMAAARARQEASLNAQAQIILDKRQKKEQVISDERQTFDLQLSEKLKNKVKDDEEDYTPKEVNSRSFFLHVTTEAEKDRIALPVKQQAQKSPISVKNGISSPKGILKKK